MSSFNTNKKQGALRVPASVVESIESVLDYLWTDEFRDYQCRTKAERERHVFRELLRIRSYLNKKLHAEKQGS